MTSEETEGRVVAAQTDEAKSRESPSFSELRGLIDVAKDILTMDAKWGNFSASTNVSRRLFTDMTAGLGTLLDERDRLKDDTETLAFERDEFASKATNWEICSDSWKARALSAEGEVEKLKAELTAATTIISAHQTLASGKITDPTALMSLIAWEEARRSEFLARQALSQEIG